MDLRSTAEQELLRRTVREFAEAEIRPFVMDWDEAQAFPAELVPRMASIGLMGIQIPEEYGGSGLSAIDYCVCLEELARVDPSIALSVAAHNGLALAHLSMFGDEAQRRKYVPPLARGETLGAWALTEAGAGSDAAAMRTTAQRIGWRLGHQRHQAVHHARQDRGHARRRRRHGSCGRPPRHVGVRRRARDAGAARRQEGKQARHARERHERGHLRGVSRAGRGARRQRGRGVRQHAPGARRGPHRDRGARRRPGAGRLRSRASLRARAPAVRPADRVVSGDRAGSSPTWLRASTRRAC